MEGKNETTFDDTENNYCFSLIHRSALSPNSKNNVLNPTIKPANSKSETGHLQKPLHSLSRPQIDALD
jgi:hypothetical protein